MVSLFGAMVMVLLSVEDNMPVSELSTAAAAPTLPLLSRACCPLELFDCLTGVNGVVPEEGDDDDDDDDDNDDDGSGEDNDVPPCPSVAPSGPTPCLAQNLLYCQERTSFVKMYFDRRSCNHSRT